MNRRCVFALIAAASALQCITFSVGSAVAEDAADVKAARTTVVVTHAVGDMEKWLKSNNRARLFPNFCSSYRIFKHADGKRVSIVAEGVDLAKMKEMFSTPEAARAEAEDTVIEPIEIYIEVEGGK